MNISFVVGFSFSDFSRIMAYTGKTSNHRTSHSGGSRGSLHEHIYEEQPYYANERPAPRQSIGGSSRRTGEVC